VLALAGDPARGRVLYGETCARCHRSAAGWGVTLAWFGPVGFVSIMIDGAPHSRMPSFAAWPDQQLSDVHAYIASLKQ
jgi:mono/diheme cytochrome c family protein